MSQLENKQRKPIVSLQKLRLPITSRKSFTFYFHFQFDFAKTLNYYRFCSCNWLFKSRFKL